MLTTKKFVKNKQKRETERTVSRARPAKVQETGGEDNTAAYRWNNQLQRIPEADPTCSTSILDIFIVLV